MTTPLTVPQKPPKFSPAYNQLVFVVRRGTDHSAELNYRFIAKVYASDGATLISTIKQYEQADGYAVFDLHRILENYVKWYCSIDGTTGAGFETNPNTYYGYIVKFGEEYGALGAVTEHLAIVTDTERYVFNGIFDFQDFAIYDQSDWLIVTGATKKFLTNSPRNRNIRLGEKDWLYFMTDNTGPATTADHYNVVIYDIAGTNSTQTFVNGLGHATDDTKFLRIHTGPGNLNGYILSTTVYYTIQLFNAANAAISELFTYTLQDSCGKYPITRLHFLNKLGGFDSFDFNMKSHNSFDITRENYKQTIGTEASGGWGFNLSDQVNTTFNVDVKPKISIESDWITDAQSTWLLELLTSPVVLWERDSSTFIAMVLTSTSYEIKQKANEKLINVQLELSPSYDLTRQRG